MVCSVQRLVALATLLVLGAGCNQTKATSMEWIRVETDDLIIRTDVRESTAVALATKWQALRDAIADNELPCAFERSNSPFEFVLLRDPAAIVDLHHDYTAGVTVRPPSNRVDGKTQYVMDYREARLGTQLVNGTDVWMLPLRLAPDFDELREMDAEAFHFVGKRRSVDDLRATTAHYAGSWNAVHMLQFGDENLRQRFERYLSALNEGESNDHAWNREFAGVDVSARYDRYLRTPYEIGSRPVPPAASRAPSVPPSSRPPSSGTAAVTPSKTAGRTSMRGPTPSQAPRRPRSSIDSTVGTCSSSQRNRGARSTRSTSPRPSMQRLGKRTRSRGGRSQSSTAQKTQYVRTRPRSR